MKALFRKIKKYAAFFFVGGVGYVLIELLWRGRTHWTMAIAGGICFIIFSLVAEKLKDRTLLLKAAVCALGVTLVEFIFGVIFNLMLGMAIWDYSDVPFNLLGQICPGFTLLWMGLGILFLPMAQIINDFFEEHVSKNISA